jgi:hypothetical protein
MTYREHIKSLKQQRRALMHYMLRDAYNLSHQQEHMIAWEVGNISLRIKEIASDTNIKRTDLVPLEIIYITANLHYEN